MKDHRMPFPSPKGRNNDLSFPSLKSADKGIDRPCLEERLIAKGNENRSTPTMHHLETSPNRGTHSPLGIGIDSHFYLSPQTGNHFELPFHSFILLAQYHHDFVHSGSKERMKTMLKNGLTSPREG
jgi:hypothetical protein